MSKQRLQRFLIIHKIPSEGTRVIGTNGGLPFVEAAADKHASRLNKRDGEAYKVVEITKLTKA